MENKVKTKMKEMLIEELDRLQWMVEDGECSEEELKDQVSESVRVDFDDLDEGLEWDTDLYDQSCQEVLGFKFYS